jgi:hypothetical protein
MLSVWSRKISVWYLAREARVELRCALVACWLGEGDDGEEVWYGAGRKVEVRGRAHQPDGYLPSKSTLGGQLIVRYFHQLLSLRRFLGGLQPDFHAPFGAKSVLGCACEWWWLAWWRLWACPRNCTKFLDD